MIGSYVPPSRQPHYVVAELFRISLSHDDHPCRDQSRGTSEHQLNEGQSQTLCLNLLTNTVIAWNTIYIGRIQKHLASSDTPLSDETIRHTSPTTRAHINVYGRYDLHFTSVPPLGAARTARVDFAESHKLPNSMMSDYWKGWLFYGDGHGPCRRGATQLG